MLGAMLTIATAVKILLMPTYYSTDFEVHRNWMAITNSKPLAQWYYEDTSEWTLDYPPFFAWFEYALSHAARLVDPGMLRIDNLGYASWGTVLYQRVTVIATEALYFFAIWLWFCDEKKTKTRQIGTALACMMPGLLFVDNIHFQYNGFLYGIQLLSVYFLSKKRFLVGGALFAITMNFKHIYLYQAPAYFVYILADYCFVKSDKGKYTFSLLNLLKIGATVVTVFFISFGPFIDHIPQVLSRLFPFKRGLCHAYWAPNFWALYSFADRAAIQVAKVLKIDVGFANVVSLTRGIVGNTTFAILPNIQPLHTVVLTVLFQLPSLYKTWRNPSKDTFMEALILCGYSSFLFGWHVHEKAILLVLIPLSVISIRTRRHAQLYFILSCSANVSLFPLLFQPTETPTKVIVTLLYAVTSYHFLAYVTTPPTERRVGKVPPTLSLSIFERLYVFGLPLLWAYAEVIHPLAVGKNVLQFLPLMLVSTYCSVGILYCFIALQFV